MNKEQLRTTDYLSHIIQAIERITTYTEDIDELGFLNNEMIQDAVIRNIEIIGEAAHNIDSIYPSFANAHPNVPWQDMYWMRNRVSHGYFSVDLEIIWKTIQRDIPELAEQVKDVLNKLLKQSKLSL